MRGPGSYFSPTLFSFRLSCAPVPPPQTVLPPRLSSFQTLRSCGPMKLSASGRRRDTLGRTPLPASQTCAIASFRKTRRPSSTAWTTTTPAMPLCCDDTTLKCSRSESAGRGPGRGAPCWVPGPWLPPAPPMAWPVLLLTPLFCFRPFISGQSGVSSTPGPLASYLGHGTGQTLRWWVEVRTWTGDGAGCLPPPTAPLFPPWVFLTSSKIFASEEASDGLYCSQLLLRLFKSPQALHIYRYRCKS